MSMRGSDTLRRRGRPGHPAQACLAAMRTTPATRIGLLPSQLNGLVFFKLDERILTIQVVAHDQDLRGAGGRVGDPRYEFLGRYGHAYVFDSIVQPLFDI